MGAYSLLKMLNRIYSRLHTSACIASAGITPSVRSFLKKTAPLASAAAKILTVFSAAALFISQYFQSMADLRVWLRLSLCVFLFAALAALSRENLELIFLRRGVVQGETQKKIALYAKRTLLILYAAFLLVLNLKGIVVFAINLACIAVRQIIRWVVWLIGLLHAKTVPYAEQFGFMPFDPRPSPSPLAVFLFYFTAYSVLMFSLCFIMPLVFGKLKDACKGLRAKISALFVRKGRRASVEAEEYSETVDTVRKLVDANPPSSSGPTIFMLAKALESTLDTAAKMRLIYAIVMKTLSEYGLPLKKSDTAWEIAEKAGNIAGIGSCLDVLTGLYNNVRYGGMIPQSQDLPEAEECFRTIVNGLLK